MTSEGLKPGGVSILLGNRPSAQRLVKWRTGSGANLFPVTQMKPGAGLGCWPAPDHLPVVPLSTSSLRRDLCKQRSSCTDGLRPSRTPNQEQLPGS